MSPQRSYPGPSQSVQGTVALPPLSFWSWKNILLWAVLSSAIHLGLHSLENVSFDEPSQLVQDIQKVKDKKYEFDHFYKWMVKEIKKDASKGSTTVIRPMKWHWKAKKTIEKSISIRMAKEVAAKLRSEGLNAMANEINVTVELD